MSRFAPSNPVLDFLGGAALSRALTLVILGTGFAAEAVRAMLGQPQFAIMSLHYLTRNIQSETGAAWHRRCVLAAAVALKDQFRLSGGESRAVVANA